MLVTKTGLGSPYIASGKAEKSTAKQPQDKKHLNATENIEGPAVIVDLSEKAKNASLTVVNIDASGPLEFRDTGIKIRIDSEAFLEYARFRRDSVEEFIGAELSGVMKKSEANLTALELGHLISSSSFNNGATVEERAINREIGIRLAEHFANTHFDNLNERDAFMERIRDFAEQDAKLDKGYYRWDGQWYESYKPPPRDIAWAEAGNGKPWTDKAVEAFEENERKITERIAKATATVSDEDVAGKLEQLMEKFGMISNIEHDDNEYHLNSIKWVRDILDRYFGEFGHL